MAGAVRCGSVILLYHRAEQHRCIPPHQPGRLSDQTGLEQGFNARWEVMFDELAGDAHSFTASPKYRTHVLLECHRKRQSQVTVWLRLVSSSMAHDIFLAIKYFPQ